MKNKHILWFLLGLIVFIFTVNMFALKFYLYWRISWLDIPMHFLGGLWLGLGALWLYFLSGKFKNILDKHCNPFYVTMLSVFSAVVFGGLWEMYEFGVGVWIKLAVIYDMQDTVMDVIMDILGAFVAAMYFIKGRYYNFEESK